MFTQETLDLAAAVVSSARDRNLRIATAESCTGGLVAAALTEIPGASRVFESGWVVYANAAKMAHLSVPEAVLDGSGAVSAQAATEMAEGALAASGADLAVAVTGVAGPDGGTAAKPVGLVWFGLAERGSETTVHEMRYGDLGRGEVRRAAVKTALAILLEGLEA